MISLDSSILWVKAISKLMCRQSIFIVFIWLDQFICYLCIFFKLFFSLFSVWDFVWWRGSGRRDIPQTDLPHDLVWQGEAVFLSQTWPILRPCKVRIPCTGTWYSKARLSSCIVTWYVKAGLLYLMTWCGQGCLLNCDLLCHGQAALSHDLVWQSNAAFLWPSVARWLIFYDLVQ